ncbi:MAG: (2Fe-2S)-binding protein [Proteobacteria bacterium]|nr:(2Fe-2S)-binding protein [Pseudomonadota bacterium]
MGFRVTSGTFRPDQVSFTFDGVAIEAYPAETVAAALIANDVRGFRRDRSGRLRGPYCNMGTCFECVVEVRAPARASGVPFCDPHVPWRTVRACLLRVEAGLEVRSRKAPGIKDLSA